MKFPSIKRAGELLSARVAVAAGILVVGVAFTGFVALTPVSAQTPAPMAPTTGMTGTVSAVDMDVLMKQMQDLLTTMQAVITPTTGMAATPMAGAAMTTTQPTTGTMGMGMQGDMLATMQTMMSQMLGMAAQMQSMMAPSMGMQGQMTTQMNTMMTQMQTAIGTMQKMMGGPAGMAAATPVTGTATMPGPQVQGMITGMQNMMSRFQGMMGTGTPTPAK
jgi:hypothetical protein